MRIDILVVSVPRYRRGHERNFVPPITGIHLAAITPEEHEVRVVHQQVEAVDLETDAELVAITFFSGFAVEAYRLADAFRARGKVVVMGWAPRHVLGGRVFWSTVTRSFSAKPRPPGHCCCRT